MIVSGQPEVVILNSVYLFLYSIYRIYSTKENTKAILMYFYGIILAMPFILIVLEYIILQAKGFRSGVGLSYQNPLSMVVQIMPYIFGMVQSYYSPSVKSIFNWDLVTSSVGFISLYLSIVAIHFKSKFSSISSVYNVMLIGDILSLSQIYGLPFLHWLGYLPVFHMIHFDRYLGPVLTVCIATLAAIGLEAHELGVLSSTKKEHL